MPTERFTLHFTIPDAGVGQLSGPTEYAVDGTKILFDKYTNRLDEVLGKNSYRVTGIVQKMWWRIGIVLFELTEDFKKDKLPIAVPIKKFCEDAVKTFIQKKLSIS